MRMSKKEILKLIATFCLAGVLVAVFIILPSHTTKKAKKIAIPTTTKVHNNPSPPKETTTTAAPTTTTAAPTTTKVNTSSGSPKETTTTDLLQGLLDNSGSNRIDREGNTKLKDKYVDSKVKPFRLTLTDVKYTEGVYAFILNVAVTNTNLVSDNATVTINSMIDVAWEPFTDPTFQLNNGKGSVKINAGTGLLLVQASKYPYLYYWFPVKITVGKKNYYEAIKY